MGRVVNEDLEAWSELEEADDTYSETKTRSSTPRVGSVVYLMNQAIAN